MTSSIQQLFTQSVGEIQGHPITSGLVGMYSLVLAIRNSIPSMQGYTNDGLTALSSSLETLTEDISNGWIQVIAGNSPYSDQSEMQAEQSSTADSLETKSTKLTGLNAQYQMHNTDYNQSLTFLQSLNSAVNQSASTLQNAMSLIINLYSSGISLQMQTVTQIGFNK